MKQFSKLIKISHYSISMLLISISVFARAGGASGRSGGYRSGAYGSSGSPFPIELIILIWIIAIIISSVIGTKKNRATEGLLYGLFLGVIGLIITLLLPEKKDAVNSKDDSNTNNNTNLLKEYGDMYKDGILTKKEFDAKKKELL